MWTQRGEFPLYIVIDYNGIIIIIITRYYYNDIIIIIITIVISIFITT